MENDLVSVIVPVYNIEKYIGNIIDSIINQSYKYLELIIVDDGSIDYSIDVAEEKLKRSTLDYKVIHQENKGLSAARNTGIKNSRGKWIICLDGDDYIDFGLIANLLEAIIINGAEIAFCDFKRVKISNVNEGITKNGGTLLLSQEELKYGFITRKLPIIVPGILFKRDIFNSLAFNENCPYAEDILFIWELLYRINKAVYVQKDYYNYLQRSDSIIATLGVNNYIKSIRTFKNTVILLKDNIKNNDKYINLIFPKFILATSHILAKNNNYKDFRYALNKINFKKYEVLNLLKLNNVKLSCFALLFLFSKIIFYRVAQKF